LGRTVHTHHVGYIFTESVWVQNVYSHEFLVSLRTCFVIRILVIEGYMCMSVVGNRLFTRG
jgi:hypothetical protein